MIKAHAYRLRLLIPGLSLVLGLVFAPVASAHVLKIDGAMSAELHIEPDDAPVAQTPVTYRLEFYEAAGTFSVHSCDCSIAFIAGGQTIARQALAPTSDILSVNTIIFPRPDTYTFRVTGSPKTAGAFAPFVLTYTVRVGAPASSQTTSPLVWWGIGIGGTAMLIYAVAAIVRRRRLR